MKHGSPVEPDVLLGKIASARKRAAGLVEPPVPQLERRYDETYWRDQDPEWMPRVAEIDITVTGGTPWIELEMELSSGPEELYRYFPFASYIYVDGKAAAVVEFTAPDQERRAIVPIPTGKTFSLSIVSELAAPPGQIDERELAITLRSIGVGGETSAPTYDTLPSDVTSLTQRANPLVEKLPQPVFVVGSYRSGTSILTWALGQHPNIWALDETRWLQLLGAGALAAYALGTDANLHYFDTYDVSRSEYMAYLGSAVDQFITTTSKRRADEVSLSRLSGLNRGYDSRFQMRRSAATPKQRWVDGTPENADCILLLHELFPAARFVCVLRDPRDVIASMLHFHRAGGSPMDVDTAASMWLQRMRGCLLAYRALGPRYVRIVHFDEFVKPSEPLRALFRFLDEPDFPTAAETFTQNINSSRLAQAEREAAYGEIARSPDVASVASALYAEFPALLAKPWEYDRLAHEQLRDIQDEIVHRMVESVL